MSLFERCYPYLSDLVRALTGLDLPLPIPMFGLLVVIAVLVSALPLRSELRRLWRSGALRGRPEAPRAITSEKELDDFTFTFAVWMLISGVLGSRLFSLLEDIPGLLADPGGKLLTRNGYNVIGGLVVATLVGIWLLRRAGLRVAPALDAAAPSVILGYAIGRIGCQVSGDGDWGMTADMALKPAWLPQWFWAQTYPGNILGETIPAPGVYPTPIWETAAGLVLFGVLWAVRRHRFRRGWLFALYVVLAAGERLAIEPLRVNERYGPWDASQAQYLSAVALVGGLAGLISLTRRRSEDESPPPVDAGDTEGSATRE